MLRAIILLLLTSSVFAAPPEVRGTWLTTTGNDNISTPQNTRDTIRRLREIGLNSVYVECWKNGCTQYPSRIAKMKIDGQGAMQRDLLQEAIIEAHRNQMLCYAWFEDGLMAAPKDVQNELRARKGWLLRDQNGSEIAPNGSVWLNPAHPDVQKLILGLAHEVAKNYDVDGIQFDDHICWPGPEMGYDEYTQNAYAADHNGERPPKNIHDVEWCRWRIAKVSDLALKLTREVHEVNPKLITSIAPGPYPSCLQTRFCDWVTWPEWDEMVIQVFRPDFAHFAPDWGEQPFFHENAIAGIRLTGNGPDLPAGDAKKCAQQERNTHGGGQCWWFSKGVLGTHAKEIAAFYDVAHQGQAVTWHRDANWRPAPIRAMNTNGQWIVNPPDEGSFTIIALIDDQWQSLGTRHFAAGPTAIASPQATQLELLLDRRQH